MAKLKASLQIWHWNRLFGLITNAPQARSMIFAQSTGFISIREVVSERVLFFSPFCRTHINSFKDELIPRGSNNQNKAAFCVACYMPGVNMSEECLQNRLLCSDHRQISELQAVPFVSDKRVAVWVLFVGGSITETSAATTTDLFASHQVSKTYQAIAYTKWPIRHHNQKQWRKLKSYREIRAKIF